MPSGRPRHSGGIRNRGIEDNYKWRAFGAIGISFFTNVMTMSMVFVALSAIADDYGVTLRAVSWVVIIEALIISSLLMPMGRVADIVGRRRMHLTGLIVFGIGAVLVGLAPSFWMLLVARVVMSTGNAMGQSVGTAMVVSVFPPEERGKAVGSQTTAVSIGGASGPLIAGLALQFVSWEWLFLALVVPISIAFVAAWFVLDEERVSAGSARRGNFDRVGAALSGLAISTLVLTLNNPLALAWTSPVIIGGGIVAVVLFTLFVRWELSVADPMLELRLFTRPLFSMAVLTRLCGFTASSATRFLLPVFLISLRGLTEGLAGTLLFLVSAGMGIGAQSCGRLSDRFGARPFVVVGLTGMVACALLLSAADSSTPLGYLAVLVFFTGLSQGSWNVPNNATILGSVPSSDLGVVGAFTNLTRNAGNVIGQALSAAVVVGVMLSQGFDLPLSEIATVEGADRAFVDGWRLAYLLVTGFAVVGLVLAILTRPPPTAGQRPSQAGGRTRVVSKATASDTTAQSNSTAS